MGSESGSIHIPYEIRANIVDFLSKEVLKQVRLVSKGWYTLATTPIFDRVFGSPRNGDLDVFNNISNHAIIGKSVKQLVYDTSRFTKDYTTLEEYYHDLWEYQYLIGFRLERFPDKAFDCGDEKSNEHVKDYMFCRSIPRDEPSAPTLKLKESHKNDRFVKKGYQQYAQNAKSDRSLSDGPFFESVTSGLSQLSRLRSVVLRSRDLGRSPSPDQHFHWSICGHAWHWFPCCSQLVFFLYPG